jgi:type III restriction enzyme
VAGNRAADLEGGDFVSLLYDEDRVAAITARLDLREPNRVALETIAVRVSQHFDVDGNPPPFRAVIDAATGVGKTYILAAVMDYFAVDGARNFAVITPGRTILEKTQANFTPGHPKSLLGGMEVEPVVITSENFASAAMRNAMDDPEKVKLYVFTVQSLTKPGTKQGKKTHDFNENLGEAFYAALQQADDLIVFADEHHTYFGPAFSHAVDDLHPRVLLGLTATPHPKTPDEQIIYRYPLAAAIADRLVKTPVLVGRKDDRADVETKLLDGLALLKLKEQAVATYCEAEGKTPVNPLMLVIAQNIDEAKEIEAVLTAPGFSGGEYADKVLTVHSDAPDQALADLDKLEDPSSPYRIVVSVGMLKEGWDNKAVYVIASMRASVSTILTEQTLGRGLRLPFGSYTGIEYLDTLEVLAHERYEELLKKAGVINQGFVDHRTQAVLKKNMSGATVSTVETAEVTASVVISKDGSAPPQAGQPVIAAIEDVQAKTKEQLARLQEQLLPRSELPRLYVPVLRMGQPKSTFSLADITETDAFENAGRSIAANPENELRRTTLSARIVTGADGLPHTELVTAEAVDTVTSTGSLLPLDDARAELLKRVLGAGIVPARAKERAAAAPIVDAFMTGLGDDAQKLLSAYMDRAAAKLIALIGTEHGRFKSEVKFDTVVELVEFSKTRLAKPTTTSNKAGKFERGAGYEYGKSMFTQDWFDSSTERDAANILESADDIVFWLRLQRNDLPIVWAEKRDYNPDFIAVDKDDAHFLIEVKMDKEMASADVLGKRKAAKRWVNHVNASPKVQATWAYLLVSEDDVRTASGSWPALQKLAG